jgi:quinoprotein glucose dehydrogenase
VACLLAAGTEAAQRREWPVYGHDPGGARFSPLKQITPANVARLKRAWVYHTGESGNFETTPIVAGGVMYLTTQAQKIAALERETGKEVWIFDPESRTAWRVLLAGDRQTGARIIFGAGWWRWTRRQELLQPGLATTDREPARGRRGQVPADRRLPVTSTPAIYQDLIIVGPSTRSGASTRRGTRTRTR